MRGSESREAFEFRHFGTNLESELTFRSETTAAGAADEAPYGISVGAAMKEDTAIGWSFRRLAAQVIAVEAA
jgi:hypothetical protein